MASILIVDDEEKMRHLLSIILEREGHQVTRAGDGAEALEIINDTPHDMVITDIKMPRMDGLQLLAEIRKSSVPCPVVFITAFATVDSAVEAMKMGAVDYITKPFDTDRILLTVARTLNLSRLMAENRELKKALNRATRSGDIIHASKAMADLLELAGQVAESDSAVLITGESGTGKELMARFIHRTSPRASERFVPVNCAAISPHLVESELFGHEKGAFTGADRKKIGKFEFAAGGTLFLDEIGDLPAEAQAKMLRALQEKTIQRVGGNEEVPVDVRVICATNHDIQERVGDGEFRQDLYFRINVFPIHLPPLRDRTEDIVPLAEHFLNRLAKGTPLGLTDGAIRTLMEYPWHGNVRELANVMERAAILSRGQGAITAETLSFLRPSGDGAACDSVVDFELPSGGISLDHLERRLVRQAMRMSGNNQTAAAELLGVTRARFRVLLKNAEAWDASA